MSDAIETAPRTTYRAGVRVGTAGLGPEKDHYYRTPVAATAALLDRETFAPFVWDPCCGDGAIAKVLVARGYVVIASDLVERGYAAGGVDFLAWGLGVRKLAVFQRLAWLEGDRRHRTIFSQMPLARVHVFTKRMTLWRGDDPNAKDKGGMIPFAWFVFDRDHVGAPVLAWIA